MTYSPLSNLIALPPKVILATFVISSSTSGNVVWNTHLSWSGSDRAVTYFADQKLEEVRRNASYSRNISLYGAIIYITGYAQRLMPRVNQGGRGVYQVNEFYYVERPSRSILCHTRGAAHLRLSPRLMLSLMLSAEPQILLELVDK